MARTIFVGSAPSVAEQRVRGLEEIRIRLGCAQPGEPAAVFGDALRRMSGQLTYLYTDGSRYWYDTRPTVNKLARDRAQSYRQEEVDAEIVDRLRAVPKNRDFAAFHVAPPETSDVVDEDRARVVVLHPEFTHKRTTGETEAVQAGPALPGEPRERAAPLQEHADLHRRRRERRRGPATRLSAIFWPGGPSTMSATN